jgi:uncharacterized YccA/Bax inhibitor family protein
MANPAFSDKALNRIATIEDTSTMTIHGTINKTGILLLILVAGASMGWETNSPLLVGISFVASLVFSLLIIFGPQRAAYLSQAYAFSEGILLGSISAMYAQAYPGIVSNALILTITCLMIMLGLYRFKIIVVTEKLRAIVLAATMAIGFTYLVSLVLGFFGTDIPMIHQSSPLGIAFSVAVVGIAAFNLLLDFDLIENLQRRGSGKFMEWYGGFALIVTLVWLYLEILRLLSKLNRK